MMSRREGSLDDIPEPIAAKSEISERMPLHASVTPRLI